MAVPAEVSVLATGDLSGVAAALDRVAIPAAFLVVGSGLGLELHWAAFFVMQGRLDAGEPFLNAPGAGTVQAILIPA